MFTKLQIHNLCSRNLIDSWMLMHFCIVLMVLRLVIQRMIAGLCWLVKWLMLVDPY